MQTGIDRCFIRGRSHHPATIFQSNVFGKTVLLRRFNERSEGYYSTLEQLEEGNSSAVFWTNIADMIAKGQTYPKTFKPPTTNESKKVGANRLDNIIPIP